MHLVCDGDGGEEVGAARVGALGGSEDRADVVGGMVRLAPGEVAVHEVEVAAQCDVVERGAVRGGAPATDESRCPVATERLCEFADRRKRRGIERGDGDADGVEYANHELFDRGGAQLGERRTMDERGQVVHFGHLGSPFVSKITIRRF